MKTTNFLRTVLVIGILASSVGVLAQGRSHNKGKGHDHDNKGRDHHHHTRVDHRHYQKPVYVHHRPAPVVERRVVYHYNQPRYVYYRDYDVYFDNHRSVYISYSGRSWTVSSSLPVRMSRVDVRRAVHTNVNYYHDDFAQRLEVRRAGGRMCSDW